MAQQWMLTNRKGNTSRPVHQLIQHLTFYTIITIPERVIKAIIPSSTPPPPAPPPPPVIEKVPTPPAPKPPAVASAGPAGAFLVELLIFNGWPFKNHWAYWVRSHANPNIGVQIDAAGDVRSGFQFEIKRSHDLHATGNIPTKRIPLQWVDAKYFNEKAMLNDGICQVDHEPVCDFETSAHKVEVPKKSLNAVDDAATLGNKITQRDCQTWIVESADQLVKDHIFNEEVVVYLHASEQ